MYVERSAGVRDGMEGFARSTTETPPNRAGEEQSGVGRVDTGIGPAGDVWVTNNWQDTACLTPQPDEAISTRCGGQGVVVFYDMAKPVRTPQIGPPRVP
jgi:hypothetical protein